jgi:hypothetical protein
MSAVKVRAKPRLSVLGTIARRIAKTGGHSLTLPNVASMLPQRLDIARMSPTQVLHCQSDIDTG